MDRSILKLTKLQIGQKGKVLELISKGKDKNRMLDLGIVHGTEIEVLQKSPSGNPIAYFIKGAVLALRNEDSDKIIVTIINN